MGAVTEAVRISSGVHRRGRGMRNATFVDRWKFGSCMCLERTWQGFDFHLWGRTAELCNESTGRPWIVEEMHGYAGRGIQENRKNGVTNALSHSSQRHK